MRFYTGQHRYYCGIDLHARTMYLCILEHETGKVLLHRNLRCEPERFLQAIEPYRTDLLVGAECIFCWYWLADLCAQHDIPFVLGHALYMKAIHGGKAKNDKTAAPETYTRLQTIPGVGRILALTLLYELHDVSRFPRVQDFLSYARLVKSQKSSAGKVMGTSGAKIGNAHLKWAYSEAAVLFLQRNPRGQRLINRLRSKHGRGKALSILAARLGRASYYMLRRDTAFDMDRFMN